MYKDSFFYSFLQILFTSFSAITGFGSFVVSFIFLIVLILMIFLIQVFVRLSIYFYKQKMQRCRIFTIRESYGNFKSDEAVIALTTYVDYFTENGVVSIFYLENGFERQIALGNIINIQEDKKVQILIFNIDKEFPCEKLLKNEKELLEKLMVKPIIKMSVLEEYHYGK